MYKEIDVSGYDRVVYKDLRVATEMFQWFADDANKGKEFRFVDRAGDSITVENLNSTRVKDYDELFDAYHALVEKEQHQAQAGYKVMECSFHGHKFDPIHRDAFGYLCRDCGTFVKDPSAEDHLAKLMAVKQRSI
jgi:hypothetical protein